MDSSLEIQAAMVAALRGDAGVTALVGARIWDIAPHGAEHPHIAFGPKFGEPWDTKGTLGWEAFLQIDCFADDRTSISVGEVQAAVGAVLHKQPLSLATQCHVSTQLEFQTTRAERDNAVVHGIQRFRVLTQQP